MSLLSVVIPSYNEEENIESTAKTIGDILTDAGIDYELVFVSDGSKDNTFPIVKSLSEKDSRIRGLQFSRNFGKESAIFAGLSAARGDCVAVIDCDLQHPPKTLVQMYRLWEEGYEVVEGIKSSRGKESLIHKMFVGIFYGIMSALMKVDMNATSDFKLLDRKAVDALLSLNESNTFFRALSFWVGFKSTSVEYDVQERTKGKSKWSFAGLVKYAISNTTSFTTAPLRIIAVVGFIMVIFSLILGIETLVVYFMNVAVEGFTTVILLLLLIGGCIMVSLGIIGHYLGRIYEEVKGRPRYIIREMTPDVHVSAKEEK
ncbi:MAG: glycosyltransferase family 2 protein [Lachnospiraceae bacterium]|nr:glycosyltransferase family 2 protein [Lachnospiraceae bacterium]MBR3636393.1 glycosyltransferase family 2 protein [Lachnospiraceae bacterium]